MCRNITLTKCSGFSQQNVEIEETFQSTTYVSFPTKTELINKNMKKENKHVFMSMISKVSATFF